ncbi:MAG: type II toxin-antitoxin system RelB/DinJ family antitoxin [Erysipelotrichaceae bacterium]|nr:type II toxin-antitoxin system RelB/DinJ family antitoxin [Erysipelotrichaceae bacterium]
MAATNLNIRTDSDLKKRAERIFSDLGLNMSSAVNMFLKAVVRENGIPFDLKMERATVEVIPERQIEPVKKTSGKSAKAAVKPAAKSTAKKTAEKKPAEKKTAVKKTAKKAVKKKEEPKNPANLIDELINSLED